MANIDWLDEGKKRKSRMMDKDFSPISQQISCHGLGFAQVVLPGNQRLHVWHPDLPRRDCFHWSPIHNHRFSFRSTVLVGTQINRRYVVYEDPDGTHDIISHDGPRSPLGGRESFVCGRARVEAMPDEIMEAGDSYSMAIGQYHETPNDGIVVTLMQKVEEGTIHANSLIVHGHEFHQGFDRFGMEQDRLWGIVLEALQEGNHG